VSGPFPARRASLRPAARARRRDTPAASPGQPA